MEIRSTGTVIDDGGYSMPLPVVGPSLGQFGTGALPIPDPFDAQTRCGG